MAVHVAILARGSVRLQDALAAAANVQLWSEAPLRICFHLLADDAGLSELNKAPLAFLAAKARLLFLTAAVVRIYNSSDAVWEQTLSADALNWLHHPSMQQSKARATTVAKLFLHELMPEDVTQALVLDSAVIAMSDVIELWEWFTQQTATRPNAVLGYAAEGQNPFRMMSSASSPSGLNMQGHNSAVGLYRLDRMRAQPAYLALLPRMAALIGQKSQHPSFEVLMMHRLLNHGEQTALAVAARAETSLWEGLVVTLPCEWNWQVRPYNQSQDVPARVGPRCACPRSSALPPWFQSDIQPFALLASPTPDTRFTGRLVLVRIGQVQCASQAIIQA